MNINNFRSQAANVGWAYFKLRKGEYDLNLNYIYDGKSQTIDLSKNELDKREVIYIDIRGKH